MKIKLFFPSVLLLFAVVLNGQNSPPPLLNYIDQGTIIFSTTEQEKINRWQSIPLTDQIYFVEVGLLDSIQNNGTIIFNLPDIANPIQATTNSVVYDSTDTYTWSGIIDNYAGNVLFIHRDQKTFGYINYLDRTYSLKSFNDDYSVLIRHDETLCIVLK